MRKRFFGRRACFAVLVLFVAALTLGLASCKNGTTDTNPFEGTWSTIAGGYTFTLVVTESTFTLSGPGTYEVYTYTRNGNTATLY